MKEFDLVDIRRHALTTGMNLGNTEKDYALSVALVEIAGTNLCQELVFKGGTSLKKAYYPDFRFSSDLDFTAIASSPEQHKARITDLFRNRVFEGLPKEWNQ